MSRNKVRLEKLEKIMGVKNKKYFVVLPELLAEGDQEVICFHNMQRTTLTKEEFSKVPEDEIGDILNVELDFV